MELAFTHSYKGEWDEAQRECEEALDLSPSEIWVGWAMASHFSLQAYRGERGWLDDWRARKPSVIRAQATVAALAMVG